MANEIIYTSEDGDEYSREHIKFEIVEYINARPEFFKLTDEQYDKCIDIIYDIVMAIMTWEHPCTVLDQFDKEDFDIIFEKLNLL